MIQRFDAKTYSKEVEAEATSNEWLDYLETGKKAPLAVKRSKRKRPLKISYKQQRGIRRE